jgi:cytochrome b
VRLAHWTLVAGFAIAYLTGEEEGSPDTLHVWSGYGIGAIIVLRLLWGFLGPRHARFSDFIRGPITSLRYLIDLSLGRARRYVGHSPAGGAMVIVLLAFLAATVATGLVAYGEQGKGPLAIVRDARMTSLSEGHGRNAEQKEASESAIGELHAALATITLALVVLHVGGVALASIVHRENLVVAMITGRKRASDR